MKKKITNFIFLLLVLSCFCTSCIQVTMSDSPDTITQSNPNNDEVTLETFAIQVVNSENWFDSVPDYRGTPYIEVNSDIPFFTAEDKQKTEAFELYSDLDDLGRCHVAYANICEEIMPTEDRETSLFYIIAI